MGSRYETRWFEPDDLRHFQACFKLVFGSFMTEEFWQWKYLKNPLIDEKAPIIVAEEVETGKAVGFRGCVPTQLGLGSEFIKAMYFADVMVHPDHRRFGINTLMIEYALSEFKDSPYKLYYNFPRTATHMGNIKTGFRSVCPVNDLLLVMNPKKLAHAMFSGWFYRNIAPPIYSVYSLLRRPSRKIGTKVTLDSCEPDDAIKMYNVWRETTDKIHTVRDIKYIKWRFNEIPQSDPAYYIINKDGAPQGYFIVTRKQDETDSIILSDYIIVNNDLTVLSEAIEQLANEYRQKSSLMTWAFTVPEIHNYLRGRGFLESTRFPLKDYVTQRTFVTRPTNLEDDTQWIIWGADISKLESWYLTPSDTDIT